MNDPLVSVLVTVKNGERYLREALASIRAQAYQPMEIILIDGQSVDGTAGIAMGAEDVRYVRQAGEGLASARNQGIEAARGELIAFLDADDEWAPGKLRRQVDHLREHPGMLGSITWLHFEIDPQYLGLAAGDRRFYEDDMVGYTAGTLVARSELFGRVGQFDPAYAVACDADWFARLLDAAQPVAVLPQVLLLKRIHGGNMSLDRAVVRRETLAVVRESVRRKRRRGRAIPDDDRRRGRGVEFGEHAAQRGDGTAA